MSFKNHYLQLAEQGNLQLDTAQLPLVDELDRLSIALQHYPPKFDLSRALPFIKPSSPPKGIYVWGDVGRGKTHIMNLFYDELPFKDKWRIHYHHFMQWVHEQNGRFARERDPLKPIAARVRSKNRILCLDEFMVTDIADAMILHRLLKHLFKQGVVLVTTSNRPPDELYYGGLQRESFLPAIELIKQHTETIDVNGDKDYRKQAWISDEIYYSPLGQRAEDGLRYNYQQITGTSGLSPQALLVAGREIQTISVDEDVAWFDFSELCDTPRSQKDYIQLSNQFKTLMISNIPTLTSEHDNAARRLINLIDTAYDYGVNLLISATLPPDQIYQGNQLVKPFKRTTSRLWEMSTRAYQTGQRQVIKHPPQ